MLRDDDNETLLRVYRSFRIPFSVGFLFSIELRMKKYCNPQAWMLMWYVQGLGQYRTIDRH
jgi:hypothetical protein